MAIKHYRSLDFGGNGAYIDSATLINCTLSGVLLGDDYCQIRNMPMGDTLGSLVNVDQLNIALSGVTGASGATIEQVNTILSGHTDSANPHSQYLLAANNLSDLIDDAAARTNLGVLSSSETIVGYNTVLSGHVAANDPHDDYIHKSPNSSVRNTIQPLGNYTALIVSANATQAVNLAEFRDSTGTTQFRLNNAAQPLGPSIQSNSLCYQNVIGVNTIISGYIGDLITSTPASAGRNDIEAQVDEVPLRVYGKVGNTSSILEIFSSTASTSGVVIDMNEKVTARGFDARSERITSVGNPTTVNDAVNVAYLLSNTLLQVQNLADLTSASSARTNLGLGDLATLNTVDTAQIDDSAVTIAKLAKAPVFGVWAEESSNLSTSTSSGFQWAYGNGANTASNRGIVVGVDCKLVSMGITCGCLASSSAIVELYVNGSGTGETIVISAGVSTVVNAFNNSGYTQLLSAGDYVNFRTVSVSGTVQGSAIVSAYFEMT